MTITSILALFVLLLIAAGTFFAAKQSKLPYTVLLVAVGILLVPLSSLPILGDTFAFLDEVVLTPELLFYVFLPMLIFESAFNMNMRKMVENAWHISLLSVVGLLFSATLIATGVYFALNALGIAIPFVIALLFGAVISATDPVAVLSLFKEYNAPKRLTLIFEGESLFNDGTAVALFIIVLAIAEHGFNGTETVIHGMSTFIMMVALGIVFGVTMATLFSKAIRYTRSDEFVSIMLLIVSAHIVFILSELLNEQTLFGVAIHVSPIIATTVSSLFLGTYARHILSPKTDSYLHKSIEHLAFIANSLVFLLAGLLFASTQIDLGSLWLPILVTILIVAAARAASIYAVILPLNKFRPVSKISPAWTAMLAWGSLRGALAIIVVLLVPDTLTVAGWNGPYTIKELLLALTIGCILATLFVKATTIGPLITKLGINKPSKLQQAWTLHLGVYYLLTEQNRVAGLQDRGYISSQSAHDLQSELSLKITAALDEQKQLFKRHGARLAEQSLHYLAIAVEEHYLKTLYASGEVPESVYRKIKGKLTLQQEKIEYAQHEAINPSSYRDRKDVFEGLVQFTQNAFTRSKTTPLEEQYLYYRAQAIVARKAIKTLRHIQDQYEQDVFHPGAYDKVLSTYEQHMQSSNDKVMQLEHTHAATLAPLIDALSHQIVHSTGDKALKFYQQRGLTTESLLHSIDTKFSLSRHH